jgi:hypothetical protein
MLHVLSVQIFRLHHQPVTLLSLIYAPCTPCADNHADFNTSQLVAIAGTGMVEVSGHNLLKTCVDFEWGFKN